MWILLIVAGIGLYVWSIYNKFVTIKTRIIASIQEIGNQLKRQSELIPNLIESVKGYMKHEKEVFKDITDARKLVGKAVESEDVGQMLKASDSLTRALMPIKVLHESNPELKAVETVTKLMDELRDTADKLMYSRRILIDLSSDYNIMMVTFPSNLVAKIFGFKIEEGLVMPEEGEFREVSEEERKSPKVKLE